MHRIASSILAAALLPLAALPSHAQDAGADSIPTVQQLIQWQQCREYLPNHPANTRGCRVDFDMTQTKDGKNPPQTHKDITVHLGTDMRGVVVLWHSSPFAACSLSTQPGPLARDSSANISTAITSVGGLGAIPAGQVPGQPSPPDMATASQALDDAYNAPAPPPSPAEISLYRSKAAIHFSQLTEKETPAAAQDRQKHIQAEVDSAVERAKQEKLAAKKAAIAKIKKDLETIQAAFVAANRFYPNLKDDIDDASTIRKNLAYSYTNNQDARNKIKLIDDAAVSFLRRPLPDNKAIGPLQTQNDAIAAEVDQLEQAYPADPQVKTAAAEARTAVKRGNQSIQDLEAQAAWVAYVTDAQAKVQKIMDFDRDWLAKDGEIPLPGDASVQALPIALYPESKVGVTIKCADAVTGNALFDNIQFNAYFQRPPVFDISSGVLISTLHGRQATTQAPYSAPSSATSCPATAATSTTPATTSDCPLVAINETRPQFMPGVFAEWHPFNFKLPWVHDPAKPTENAPIPTWMSEHAPRHALGYVGSFGLAGGFMVNPNNGTTTAEFFEGLSFGIERFVILIGNHNGRSQNLTDGYSIGAPVAAGTTPTTVSNWANALAFGITYRIPLR